ncbi:hypothetical protein BJ973_000237 [Actinoplanes tereljensis]|uniref:REase associating with pPIWI RE domain-containing protein n=1 Tax=Paractinoplanes tereljensis TaxID=571912 RepID=A0A919TWL7_9ACTN|nr:hypothetical protein [Actinoplanes tereljensis]GIF23405.1 hypothetical protein Ate02nite_61350 [Actinoplanes tereljensis]
MMEAARRFGRDETVTAVTQAASLWMQPESIGARWRMMAELHGPVALAHLAHGEPFLPLAAFVDRLTGPLAELLPPSLRQPCDDAALVEDGRLSATAADLLMENLAPSLSATDVASWSMPRLSAEKVQGWLYGQLLATGSEAGYRNARRTVIDNSAGEMSDVIDAIKLAGLPREGLVIEIPGHAQFAHEGEKYWFGCPVCRYPMRFQLGRVSCMYPPHAKAVGAVTVRLSRRRLPSVGAWNKARAADLGGPGIITAAPVDGHACLVQPVWRYSTIPGCEEVRLHQLLEQIPGVTATLWPYTDRYDLHVSAASRRKPWRVDVKDYADAARLANELLKRGTLTDSDLLIVVPDHRADQLQVLNERLRAGLNTRRRIAYTSSSFLKLVQKAA